MKKFLWLSSKILLLLLALAGGLRAQNAEELKMIFPGIYFKHNSTDYAVMPYTTDSCFKYIAAHINDINDLVIWRDSLETEKLLRQRVKKLKETFSKQKETRYIYIESMERKQKISRQTIERAADKAQKEYLLSLNSVFEIAKTRPTKSKIDSHYLHPKIWCWRCWINLFHLNKRGRTMRRMERNKKKKNE